MCFFFQCCIVLCSSLGETKAQHKNYSPAPKERPTQQRDLQFQKQNSLFSFEGKNHRVDTAKTTFQKGATTSLLTVMKSKRKPKSFQYRVQPQNNKDNNPHCHVSVLLWKKDSTFSSTVPADIFVGNTHELSSFLYFQTSQLVTAFKQQFYD